MTRAAIALRIVDATMRGKTVHIGCRASGECDGESLLAAIFFALAWARWRRIAHAHTVWS